MSMTENVLKTLSVHRRTAWLFPKLQGIEWNIADDARFPYLQLFLHPGITKVGLYPDGRTSLVNIRDSIQALRTACIALEALIISPFYKGWEPEGPHMSHENIAAISKDLSSLITHSTSLQRLYMHHPQLTLGADVIEHLALSPNLRALQLQNEKLDILGDDRGERSNRVLFPCLQSLGAEIEEPKALLNILRQTATTTLIQFTITSKSLIRAAHFSTLLTEIARCGSKHLTSLSLYFCSSQHPGQEDQYRLTSAHFQPLLALSKIRYLTIYSPFIEPDDRLLSQIAQAWPELGSLHFDPTFKPIGEIMSQIPLVTLNGVYALIRGCNNLIAVHMAIDTAVPLSPGLPALPLNTTVNTICFDFSWLKPTVSAAMMIDGIGRIHRSSIIIKESDPWLHARHHDRVVSAQAAGIDITAYDEHVRTSAAFWRGIGRALNNRAGVVVDSRVTVLPHVT
jgi:hypothetical protein